MRQSTMKPVKEPVNAKSVIADHRTTFQCVHYSSLSVVTWKRKFPFDGVTTPSRKDRSYDAEDASPVVLTPFSLVDACTNPVCHLTGEMRVGLCSYATLW